MGEKKEYYIEFVKYGTVHFTGTLEEARAKAEEIEKAINDDNRFPNFVKDKHGIGWNDSYAEAHGIFEC